MRNLKSEVEKLKLEMASLLGIKVDEKALEIAINHLREDVIKLKLDNKIIEHKINMLEAEREK